MKRFLLLAVTLLSVTCLAHANLLTNGDFEAGDTGFTTGYVFEGGAPPLSGAIGPQGTYTVISDPSLRQSFAASFGDHTTGAGLMMAINGATSAGLTVWSEVVAVTGGQSHQFSGWFRSWDPFDVSPPSLDIEVTGDSSGTTTIATGVTGTVAGWTQFTAGWVSAVGDTSATIRIVDTNLANVGNDFALDDLAFVIPEPSTAVLFGGGLLGLLGYGWRRKRRNNA